MRFNQNRFEPAYTYHVLFAAASLCAVCDVVDNHHPIGPAGWLVGWCYGNAKCVPPRHVSSFAAVPGCCPQLKVFWAGGGGAIAGRQGNILLSTRRVKGVVPAVPLGSVRSRCHVFVKHMSNLFCILNSNESLLGEDLTMSLSRG